MRALLKGCTCPHLNPPLSWLMYIASCANRNSHIHIAMTNGMLRIDNLQPVGKAVVEKYFTDLGLTSETPQLYVDDGHQPA